MWSGPYDHMSELAGRRITSDDGKLVSSAARHCSAPLQPIATAEACGQYQEYMRLVWRHRDRTRTPGKTHGIDKHAGYTYWEMQKSWHFEPTGTEKRSSLSSVLAVPNEACRWQSSREMPGAESQ
jgi:hypothetical protein